MTAMGAPVADPSLERAQGDPDGASKKIHGEGASGVAKDPVPHYGKHLTLLKYVHHFEYPSQVTLRVYNAKRGRTAGMFKIMEVHVTFFPMEQKAHRRIERIERRHGGLPASHVGGKEHKPPSLADKVLEDALIAAFDAHAFDALDAQCGPVDECFAETDIDPVRVEQFLEGVSRFETPRQIRVGFLLYRRPAESIVKGNAIKDGICRFMPAEPDDGIEDVMLEL